MIEFKRELHQGDSGTDVEGVGRALCRGGYFIPLRVFASLPGPLRRRYGARKAAAVFRLRDGHTKVYDQAAHYRLLKHFDAKATALYESFKVPPPPPSVCFPLPKGPGEVCQGFHRTAGDRGFAENWAIDFCCPPGTPALAVENAKIVKLSGHSPDDDTFDAQGIFGWSIHYETPNGYHYYLTHLGHREMLSVGQAVKAGQKIGSVGDQEFRPDHLHLGVTSPKGAADARAHILEVSKAPRVELL